jgi:hypothetical protein
MNIGRPALQGCIARATGTKTRSARCPLRAYRRLSNCGSLNPPAAERPCLPAIISRGSGTRNFQYAYWLPTPAARGPRSAAPAGRNNSIWRPHKWMGTQVAKRKLRSKIPQLEKALSGNLRCHHKLIIDTKHYELDTEQFGHLAHAMPLTNPPPGPTVILVTGPGHTCGGTVSCISIFTAIIQRPKSSNQTPGELIGEGARPVFGRPQGDHPRTRKIGRAAVFATF